jgi:hypothetical protein
MITQQFETETNIAIGTIGRAERIFRLAISLVCIETIFCGVAVTPIEYSLLSVLTIYLVHTAILGLDPFYAAVHFVHLTVTRWLRKQPVISAQSS